MSKDEKTEPDPRLITGLVALRYLGGERPERFGVNPIKGKRRRLYDRRAIDVALDRVAGLPDRESAGGEGSTLATDPAQQAADEWFAGAY